MALGPRSPEWDARMKAMHGDRADEYEISGRMDDALRAVIADPGIASVDDHAIRVVGDWPQGFRYLSEVIHIPGMGSSASPGGFGYTIVPPVEAGTGALGVYFPLGQFGAFFPPPARPGRGAAFIQRLRKTPLPTRYFAITGYEFAGLAWPNRRRGSFSRPARRRDRTNHGGHVVLPTARQSMLSEVSVPVRSECGIILATCV